MQIEYSDDTLSAGTDGVLLVLCWWNAPTLEQMLIIDQISAAREKRLSQKTAYTQFVLEGTPVFTAEVRAIAERITRDYYAMRDGLVRDHEHRTPNQHTP